MLTKEELTEAYKKFDDDRIIQLAKLESKSLREIEVPIIENEILNRNLEQKLFEWIKNNNRNSSLEIIPGATHTFNTKHPFEGPSPQLEKMLHMVVPFIQNNQ